VGNPAFGKQSIASGDRCVWRKLVSRLSVAGKLALLGNTGKILNSFNFA
jgi:hypothetical protein